MCCLIFLLRPVVIRFLYTLYDTFFMHICNICDLLGEVYIIGDLNMFSSSDKSSNLYNYMLSYCSFANGNNVQNVNGRTLDEVLSVDGRVTVECCYCPFVCEDDHHPALSVSIHTKLPRLIPPLSPNLDPSTSRNFSKGDYASLYRLL